MVAATRLRVNPPWAGDMQRRGLVVLVVFAGVLEVLLLNAWVKAQGREPVEPAPAGGNGGRTLALGASALFPIALVALAATARIDGFSVGAIVLAVGVQTFIFVGWVGSPTREPEHYFWTATLFPVVLVLTTLLFNHLQKEA